MLVGLIATILIKHTKKVCEKQTLLTAIFRPNLKFIYIGVGSTGLRGLQLWLIKEVNSILY